ncbi:MAG: hypothetical protein ACHQ17_03855 [Polyangia bacterium]
MDLHDFDDEEPTRPDPFSTLKAVAAFVGVSPAPEENRPRLPKLPPAVIDWLLHQ